MKIYSYSFGSSVHPIPTRGGRLYPPHYCLPTRIWKPSGNSEKDNKKTEERHRNMIWTRVWPKLGGSCLLVICYAAQCAAAARACASCAVGSNSHRQFHFLIKMSFDNKAAQAAAAASTVTPTTSPSTWAHPEMMLKRTAKRPSLETSIRHPTIVTIMCPCDELTWVETQG